MQAVAATVARSRRRVVQAPSVGARPVSSATNRTQPQWSALVHRVAGGDETALAQLYDETSQLVCGLALRILGNRDAAEDVVIEVYAQAWRDAKSYEVGRGSPMSWLLTMTRSRAIDVLRARRRDQATDPIESAAHVHADAPTPEDATADAERHRFVRGALIRLAIEQREAIELAYFAGLSHSEIAMRLGQPLGTVKTRIRLGMTRLRELLGHLTPPTVTEEAT